MRNMRRERGGADAVNKFFVLDTGGGFL